MEQRQVRKGKQYGEGGIDKKENYKIRNSTRHLPRATKKVNYLKQIKNPQLIKASLLPCLICVYFSRITKKFLWRLDVSLEGTENTAVLHVSLK
jgi:hypothetical protein